LWPGVHPADNVTVAIDHGLHTTPLAFSVNPGLEGVKPAHRLFSLQVFAVVSKLPGYSLVVH
jgi:hypothetical protein